MGCVWETITEGVFSSFPFAKLTGVSMASPSLRWTPPA